MSEIADIESKLGELTTLWPQLDKAYSSLADERSRDLMVELFAFRLLGSRRVRLSTNCDLYHKQIGSVLQLPSRVVPVPEFCIRPILEYDCRPIGRPITLTTHPLGVAAIFVQEQYALRRGSVCISVKPGDFVLDLGGCWGDSTLYFALEVGESGRVIGFEFVPDNLQLLNINLNRNPELASRIEIDQRAVWCKSGETLGFDPNGPATKVATHDQLLNVKTTTLDDLKNEKQIDRINFIKMDIEGAELHALHGARELICRDRPRLAIAAYHKLTDIPDFIEFLLGLDLGYRFYIDHFTIHAEETVLFAVSEPES